MAIIRLPGLIDPHVHLRDPGQTHKEDFYTGTKAALAGGYTTVIDMPNNLTPITTLERLEEKIKIAKEKIVCDVGFYFGSVGDNLDEFKRVEDKVLGLKLYLNQTTGNFLLDPNKLEQIFKAFPQNLPILVHAVDEKIEEVIAVLQKVRRPIHIVHVSSKFELEQVMEAKNDNLPITCGVTPHHLFLTEADEPRLGPFGVMKPPLRSKKDVEFLWKNLGAIDCIESDHAPHTIDEKEGSEPIFGVPGLETTLPLLLTAANDKRLTTEDIIRLCHDGPSDILGIKQDPQTYIEVDPNSEFIILNSELHTKCTWSPFEGMKATGRIQRVCIRGKKVFEDDQILAAPRSGQILDFP